jgi:hypothetical protein
MLLLRGVPEALRMKMRCFARVGVFGIVLAGPAAVSQAVITHPVDDPNLSSLPKPNANVVGKWDVDGIANASLVAIDPNHAITTRHQAGGGVNSIVTFGGTRYKIAQETPIGGADLRVLTLTQEFSSAPANLSAFTPVYTGLISSFVQPVTIGGFGRPRGATLLQGGQPYGYAWNLDFNGDMVTDNVNQTPQSFGRNVVDATQPGATVGSFVNDVLIADFDGPGLGVTGEANVAEFDSGGGWFYEVSPGVWQVAGLTEGFQHTGVNIGQPANQDLFAAFNNAAVPQPDLVFAIDLTTYRNDIAAAVPEPACATLLVAGGALLGRRRARSR